MTLAPAFVALMLLVYIPFHAYTMRKYYVRSMGARARPSILIGYKVAMWLGVLGAISVAAMLTTLIFGW